MEPALTSLPHIHLCIVQPPNYVHALGFIDQARYFRHQFRRMGAQVSLAQNRLRHDAVNFVFGAHLGFDASLRQRYSCVFVNLEQLGRGGAAVSSDYMKLLAGSAVVDYDADNLAAYTQQPEDVPIVPFLYAPYLRPAEMLPLQERPIDVLFIGSMNERRRHMIQQIEATGVSVSMFDGALYGPERDQFILQAKAVFNAHFYETSRFEQARASHCLSLGTPVISERREQTRPHAAFEDSVLWLKEADLPGYFGQYFGTPAFYAEAEAAVQAFTRADPIDAYADLLAFAAGFGKVHQEQRPQTPWQPDRIRLGSALAYQPGWLHLGCQEHEQPDLLLDLGQPVQWPLYANSSYAGDTDILPDSVNTIYASHVLERTADLPVLMSNCLTLLTLGGRLIADIDCTASAQGGADPRQVHALNAGSWHPFTDQFWQMGWFTHRFELEAIEYLDARHAGCPPAQAALMRVSLLKVDTSLQERNVARMMRADYALPDDEAPSPSAADAAMAA
jgi:hypothetical protein